MKDIKGEKGRLTKELIIRQKGWFVPTIHRGLLEKEIRGV